MVYGTSWESHSPPTRSYYSVPTKPRKHRLSDVERARRLAAHRAKLAQPAIGNHAKTLREKAIRYMMSKGLDRDRAEHAISDLKKPSTHYESKARQIPIFGRHHGPLTLELRELLDEAAAKGIEAVQREAEEARRRERAARETGLRHPSRWY